MKRTLIRLIPTWQRCKPDGSVCALCEQTMYSPFFILSYRGKNTMVKLCRWCKGVISEHPGDEDGIKVPERLG